MVSMCCPLRVLSERVEVGLSSRWGFKIVAEAEFIHQFLSALYLF